MSFIDCTMMAHTRPGVPAKEVFEKGSMPIVEKGCAEEMDTSSSGWFHRLYG